MEEFLKVTIKNDAAAWRASRGAGSMTVLDAIAKREIIASPKTARIVYFCGPDCGLDRITAIKNNLPAEAIAGVTDETFTFAPVDACAEDYDDVVGRVLLMHRKPRFRQPAGKRQVLPKTYFAYADEDIPFRGIAVGREAVAKALSDYADVPASWI